MAKYSGVIVPLVTPLDADGAVCADSVARLVESVGPHVSGLMPTLSSGEGWKLDTDRWQRMVELTVAAAAGLPVFVGIQQATTSEVLARARLLATLRVDGIVVTTPFGSGVTQAQTLEHYRVIRDESGADLFVYNAKIVYLAAHLHVDDPKYSFCYNSHMQYQRLTYLLC